MWPYKTILYFILFWVGCFAALVNPIWGVVNYMMAYQMNPPITWWGAPLVRIGLRFSMLAVGFTILGIIVARKRVPKTRPLLSTWEMGVLALVALAVINIAFGVGYGPSARYAFEKFWKLQVFILILAHLATTRENFKLVIWTLVAGSAYLGYDAYTASYRSFLLGRLEAFGGPDISTSSGAAAHLTAMLPIIAVAFLIAKKWKWKAAAAISGALTINAIVLCRTRSAFIALLVGIVTAVIMAPRARRYRIHGLLVIGVLLASALADPNYWDRMGTMAHGETLEKDGAVVARMDIMKASWHLLADHPMGVGLGNFSVTIGKYDPRYRNRSPHNTLIMVFCELGIIGGLIFLALCLQSVRLLYRCSKLAHLTEHPIETQLIAYGLLISMVSYFVAGLGTERFSCESFWWVLVFPLCLHRMVTREVAAREEVPALVPEIAPVDVYPTLGSPNYEF